VSIAANKLNSSEKEKYHISQKTEQRAQTHKTQNGEHHFLCAGLVLADAFFLRLFNAL